jgi:hypothetical protein
MAERLPETIELGPLTLTRHRDSYNGKPTNLWLCPKNHNILTRHGPKSWSFEGSPLEVIYEGAPKCSTPELAYIAALQHNLAMLEKEYARDKEALQKELWAATFDEALGYYPHKEVVL